MTRVCLFLLTAAALTLAGCPDELTDDDPAGIVIYDGGSGGGPDGGVRQTHPVMGGEVAPYYGFVSSTARAEYYYLGPVATEGGKVPTNTMYFFYDETGAPLFRLSRDGTRVMGWHPVVDVVPTKQGYSPFWKVAQVIVKGTVDKTALEDLTCPAGKKPCGFECAALNNSPKHCGQCDNACKTGQYCSAGKCLGITCESDLKLCVDKCANLQNDILNCGACGTRCKTTETCSAGKCVATACKAGLSACTVSGTSECLDLTSEQKHCGTCGKACVEDKEQCILGRCSTCKGGNVFCGGTCANLQNDINNCGTCGTKCAADQRCYQGVCSFGACQMDAVCPGELKCVEGRCTDPVKVGIYPLDGLKSRTSLDDSGLTIKDTNILINCPVVDADAKLLKGISDPDQPFPKMQLWFKRLKAFCFLVQGAKELLGQGAPAIAGGALPATPPTAYFIRQDLAFGGTKSLVSVYARRNLLITNALPGQTGYSPLVKGTNLIVTKDHEFKDMRSVAEVKAKLAAKTITEEATTTLHNVVVRGTIPECTSDLQCAKTGGRVDPPLKCSVESGYCSPPFARFGEECRRDVKECDPKGGAGGTRLACVGLRARDKYFCFNACDSSKSDTNPDAEIDSRCGSVSGTRCYALRQSNPARPNGVCIAFCNALAGNKEALLKECESSTCGDGNLDFGEACDDGNRLNGDGCNKYCSLSTFDRCDVTSDCKGVSQACKQPFTPTSGKVVNNTYCLPVASKEKDESVEGNKYRRICMEANYCWPPDVRADWLGKTEAGQ